MRRGHRETAFTPRAYPVIRSRDAEGRQIDLSQTLARPTQDRWRPSTVLVLPEDEGFDYRWVREYTNGEMDTNRTSLMVRDGWSGVHVDDLPQGFIVDPDLHGDGLARHGGLILMRLPKELAAQRRAYYARKRAAISHGADELQGIAQKSEPGRSVVEATSRVEYLTGESGLRDMLK